MEKKNKKSDKQKGKTLAVRAEGKNQKPNSAKKNASTIKKLKLLITIVNRAKAEYYIDFLTGFEINMQTVALGYGTAGSEMLRLLGLDSSEKAVIFSFAREDNIDKILNGLSEKFSTIKNGKGIAYVVPLSSIIGVAAYGFLSNNTMTVKEEK